MTDKVSITENKCHRKRQNMHKKIINIETGQDYRIVVISDVHAHLNLFVKLLDAVSLKEDDILIILGDFLNRGIDSVETFEYVKDLSKRKNTYILKGNHESFMQRHLYENEYTEEFFDFLKQAYYETLIGTLVKQAGKSLQDLEDSQMMLDILKDKRDEVHAFLESLPIMAYVDDMRFVHGGFDESFDMSEDETRFLKFDNYNTLAKVNDRTTIVGHWPASELRNKELTNLPHFNDHKNIIFIDGGLGVKDTGELNAFIIEKTKGKKDYDLIQVNNFEVKTVAENTCFKNEPPLYLNYPDDSFDVLHIQEGWAKCQHTSSQRTFHVMTDLLVKNKDTYAIKTNFLNQFLNVSAGTQVELCKSYGEYALVKHNDNFSWLRTEQLK